MKFSLSPFSPLPALTLLLLTTLAALAQPASTPPTPQAYQLSPDFPRYHTAHIEFRDPSGARWPSFLYGKPAGNGTLTLTPPAASFSLVLTNRPQKNGDQSRRVLGELFQTPAQGAATVRITGLGPVTAGTAPETMQTTFLGTLEINGKQIPINAPATLKLNKAGRGDEKNEAILADFTLQTSPTTLGLRTLPSESPITIRIALSAYAPSSPRRR